MLHGTGCAEAEEPEAVGASGTPLAPAPGPRRLLRRLLPPPPESPHVFRRAVGRAGDQAPRRAC